MNPNLALHNLNKRQAGVLCDLCTFEFCMDDNIIKIETALYITKAILGHTINEIVKVCLNDSKIVFIAEFVFPKLKMVAMCI